MVWSHEKTGASKENKIYIIKGKNCHGTNTFVAGATGLAYGGGLMAWWLVAGVVFQHRRAATVIRRHHSHRVTPRERDKKTAPFTSPSHTNQTPAVRAPIVELEMRMFCCCCYFVLLFFFFHHPHRFSSWVRPISMPMPMQSNGTTEYWEIAHAPHQTSSPFAYFFYTTSFQPANVNFELRFISSDGR